jgi:hypothetical protein
MNRNPEVDTWLDEANHPLEPTDILVQGQHRELQPVEEPPTGARRRGSRASARPGSVALPAAVSAKNAKGFAGRR